MTTGYASNDFCIGAEVVNELPLSAMVSEHVHVLKGFSKTFKVSILVCC